MGNRLGLPGRLAVACLLGLALVLPLLPAPSMATSSALAGSVASPADPSQDLPRPPTRCLNENGSISPDVRPCWITPRKAKRPTVVLWGDSHAIQMLPAVRKAVRGRNVNLAMFALGACPPLRYGKAQDVCKGFNADALAFVSKLERKGHGVRVILGANWYGYIRLHRRLFEKKNLDKSEVADWVVEIARVFPKRAPGLMRKLGRMGVRADLIGHTATVPVAQKCSRGEEPFVCDLPRRRALPQEKKTNQWLRRVMRPLPSGARLIDVNRPFCGKKNCQGRKDGIYTFFNDLHISATRARTMKRFFTPTVNKLKRRR